MRRYSLLLTVLIILAGTAYAQTKPNFSGLWNLDASKSDFGALPAPSKQIDKIDQTASSFKITRTQTNDQGEATYDIAYSLDGSDSKNTVRGLAVTSVAKWDGDTLVVNSALSIQGSDVKIKDLWTLSPDGKTFQVKRHLSAPQGDTDQTVVMNKQ